MDPLEAIDPFLHDLVLQHFSASEILQVLSFVSPQWSRNIGQSKTCMNKVKFVYQMWRHQFYSSSDVFRCGKQSWRNFQHVVAEIGMDDDLVEFWNFIKSCSKSLKTLKVENARWNPNDDDEVLLPKLEEFAAYGVDDAALCKFLQSPNKLKNLFVVSLNSTMNPAVIECLTSCLKRNKKLEQIYLKNVNFVMIFEDILPAHVHLKSLKLMNTTANVTISSIAEQNLLNYLSLNRATLETFFFEFKSDRIAEFALNNLPALKSVGLLKLPSGDLSRNDGIKNVEIPLIDDYLSIKKFIDATPNVVNLFVGCVTNELVDYLAWNFPELRLLNFKVISLEAEEHYEELKREHPEVNQNIEIWDYENVDWD